MTPLEQIARDAAEKYKLDAQLVCAVCEQESNWQQWAIRYENAFFAKYVAGKFTNNEIGITEAYARAFSWGLMQVMGQTARDFGYSGPLPQLCDPATGIDVGCKVLAHKLAVNQGKVHDALQAWNGGANTEYANQVIARMGRYATA